MTTPTVIVGGAPKCGTTSLFDWLSDHPEVCVSNVKETRYFLDSYHPLFDPKSNWTTTGRAGYERYFDTCGGGRHRVVLEATPAYINQETALAFIPSLAPRPLMLFVLRQPAQRIYSMFQYARNNLGALPAGMTFAEFLRLNPGEYRTSAAACIAYLALEQSRYGRHLARWVERCGSENVAVFLFETMKTDLPRFMASLSARIGIGAAFWKSYAFPRKNAGQSIRLHGLHRTFRRVAAVVPPLLKPGPAKKLYYLVNAGRAAVITTEDRQALATLEERFRPQRADLARLLGIDLSPWE